MAQIRSKQITEFLDTVAWETVTANDIANASDIKSYVDSELSAVDGGASTSINSLEDALSAEISATNSDVDSLESVDGSLEDLLSAEVFALESTDTSLEDALSADIVTAEADAVASAESLDNLLSAEISTEVDTLENALSTDIVAAEADAITAAGSLDDLLSAEISTELSAEVVALESVDTLLDGRISTLENVIVEDNEFLVEEFAGDAANITGGQGAKVIELSQNIQGDLRGLVWVFINGVYTPIDSVSGKNVTLDALGYDLDATDIVKVQYQFEPAE